ncbi:hypothetical protein ACS22U_22655, partial [Escherichia coli]
KACVLPENPASYRVVRKKSYLFNKAACRRRLCSEKRVSPEANKEKSDITELLRKQIRPD